LALSGWAGTDTVQFVESAASAGVWVKLNAFPAASTAFAPARPGRPGGLMGGMPATAAAVAAGEPEPDGQGDGAADAAALAVASSALAVASGAVALAVAVASESAALVLLLALGAAEAQEPKAAWSTVIALPPPETARMIPRVRPSAIGMARGTAIRAARLFRRRRHADR
jgi:hypothetical protein